MTKTSVELGVAIVCFAIAVGFALVTLRSGREADASGRLVRVEAYFSVASVRHDVQKRDKDGTMRTVDETMVDAVYRLDGKNYRHRVSADRAMHVVSSLPGRGVLLVDPRDPTSPPPRATPAGFVGASLLACIGSALVGAMFLIAARRGRKDAAAGAS